MAFVKHLKYRINIESIILFFHSQDVQETNKTPQQSVPENAVNAFN